MAKDEKRSSPPSQSTRPWWRRRRFLILASIMLFITIALAVGLGVGLTQARRENRCRHWQPCASSTTSSDSSTPSTTTSPSPAAGTGSVTNGIWQPENGTTWQYQLGTSVGKSPSANGIDVWDIDLFDNEASAIASIQAQGSRVICYFSGGSYEDWRADKDQFNQDDLGEGLDGWEGENWLNIRSDNVRQIMVGRLDLAVQKGCDGVDPDNVDGYNNENGLGLTTDDTINYMRFLADEAHARSLSIGLKNALEVVPDLVDIMEWSVNEQCLEYDECHTLAPFIQQQKPVFHVEYPKGDTENSQRVSSGTWSSICDASSTGGFSTIIKNMNLDTFTESCPITPP